MESGQELSAMLSCVLPEYELVSKAPNTDKMWDIAESRAIDDKRICEIFDFFCETEKTKKYKSICSKTGNVFLVQNPTAWEWKFVNSDYSRDFEKEKRGVVNCRVRPKPELVMTYADLKSKVTGSKKRERKEANKDIF
jgi:hypothetical protein